MSTPEPNVSFSDSINVTIEPFHFVDIEGWSVIVTMFKDDEETMFYTPQIIIWTKFEDEQPGHPIVTMCHGTFETAEDAAITTLNQGTLFFGNNIIRDIDVITADGQRIRTMDVVALAEEAGKETVDFAVPSPVLH